MIWYAALVLATGVERIAELVVSARNARWSFARGGIEHGRRHFPSMVALHTGLLLACLAEAWFGHRPFLPGLGWPAFGLVVASQGLRWWCIGTLGRRWNTRVIVVPGLPPVHSGPYRVLRHPNYVAVVVEGVALPLVHTAWITAIAFTVVNAVLLLAVRIPCEDRALATLPAVSADAPAASRPLPFRASAARMAAPVRSDAPGGREAPVRSDAPGGIDAPVRTDAPGGAEAPGRADDARAEHGHP